MSLLGSSRSHAGGLCPLGDPASGSQRRWRPTTPQAGGRAEEPWPRPKGRCRSGAAGAPGAPVPGCAGGRGREGRRPREPDARAWRRWRRGQSRHRTLIFDLATGRCFAAGCPPGPSPSPGSGVSRSGARGDELLSAPPGSPALLLPPPLLLPPSLRQSSGGSWSRRPRPTAEGGPRPDTQTRGVRPGRPRQFDLQAVQPPPRPGPGHLAKWATPRGWASEPPTRPLKCSRGSGVSSSSPVPLPTRNGEPCEAMNPARQISSPWNGGRESDLYPPSPREGDRSLCNPMRTWDWGLLPLASNPPPEPPPPALQPTVPAGQLEAPTRGKGVQGVPRSQVLTLRPHAPQ